MVSGVRGCRGLYKTRSEAQLADCDCDTLDWRQRESEIAGIKDSLGCNVERDTMEYERVHQILEALLRAIT